MLVESAFDVLAVQQEAGDIITAVATGTTGARHIKWFQLFLRASIKLLAHDDDKAGEDASAYWQQILFEQVLRWRPVPDDPAAMLQAGLDLRAWVQQGLAAAASVSASAPTSTQPHKPILRAITKLHRQIAALGYATDPLEWASNADAEELESYRRVQQEYLAWCQQHQSAVGRLQAAWRAERDAGKPNPARELATNTDEMGPSALDQLSDRVLRRIAQWQSQQPKTQRELTINERLGQRFTVRVGGSKRGKQADQMGLWYPRDAH
jgi:hypothetical protein